MDSELTLIVVDQNEEVCHRLANSLERLQGIRVLAHTTNVMLAAQLAHQFSPNVIVADFKWGEATRADILHWLVRMCPESSVIVYSSYYRDGAREAFAAAGAGLCLLKGLNVEELGSQIRHVGALGHTKRCGEATRPGSRSG
ncbi:MAG: response regulator [Chloroflexota bacterium]